MVRVLLFLHPLFERVPGLPWWAMAWQTGKEVHVRKPFHLLFWARERLGHELAHAAGEAHHPWWHFCLLSPIAPRLWLHTKIEPAQADALLKDGAVDV